MLLHVEDDIFRLAKKAIDIEAQSTTKTHAWWYEALTPIELVRWHSRNIRKAMPALLLQLMP